MARTKVTLDCGKCVDMMESPTFASHKLVSTKCKIHSKEWEDYAPGSGNAAMDAIANMGEPHKNKSGWIYTEEMILIKWI